MSDRFDDLDIASNGCPTESIWLDGQEVVVHDDDIPQKDLTIVKGIPCTTALRTVIDIAPDVERDHLKLIVEDCLRRRLFTVDEGLARVAEPDMLQRPGAGLLARLLTAAH